MKPTSSLNFGEEEKSICWRMYDSSYQVSSFVQLSQKRKLFRGFTNKTVSLLEGFFRTPLSSAKHIWVAMVFLNDKGYVCLWPEFSNEPSKSYNQSSLQVAPIVDYCFNFEHFTKSTDMFEVFCFPFLIQSFQPAFAITAWGKWLSSRKRNWQKWALALCWPTWMIPCVDSSFDRSCLFWRQGSGRDAFSREVPGGFRCFLFGILTTSYETIAYAVKRMSTSNWAILRNGRNNEWDWSKG